MLDNAMNIQRISLANGDLAEAVAVNPREVLINGKAVGETSLIIWQQGGPRLLFDLTVRPSTTKLEDVRAQLARELPGQDVSVYLEGESAFVHGTAKDLVSAERAAAISATLGKVVNLLRVDTPAEEPQILLKVRFADVDRSASSQLGFNLFSTGATNTIGGVTTQQYSPPTIGVPTPGMPDYRHLNERAEYFPVPAGSEPGRHHRGAGSQEPAADSGGAERDGDERQTGQFHSGR